MKTNYAHDNEGKCTTDNECHSLSFVSPEGILVDEKQRDWSSQDDFKPTAHLNIPIYYIPQLEPESSVSSSNKTLSVSCHGDFSTAFLYSNNKEFTNDLLKRGNSQLC